MGHISPEPVGLNYYLKQKAEALRREQSIIYACNLGQIRSVSAALAALDRQEKASCLEGGIVKFLQENNLRELDRDGFFVVLNDQKSIDVDRAVTCFATILESSSIPYVITNTLTLMIEVERSGQDSSKYFN